MGWVKPVNPVIQMYAITRLIVTVMVYVMDRNRVNTNNLLGPENVLGCPTMTVYVPNPVNGVTESVLQTMNLAW